MDTGERHLQLILAFLVTTSTIIAFLLPNRFYRSYRTPALIMCRFSVAILPSVKVLIKRMMEEETALSIKWGQNPVGAIGLIFFSSRTLILGIASVAMPLDFLPTVILQLFLLVASWPTDLGLCAAKVASAPDILLWLSAIHSFFSIIWGICMPFFWTPLPPGFVVKPSVSFLAVTLFVQFCAVGIPIIRSAFREAARYQQEVVTRQRMASSTATSSVPFRNSPNLANTTILATNNATRGLFSTITSSVSNDRVKGPPLAARICMYYQHLLHFPAHAVWISAVSMSLLFTLSYRTAERICADTL
jgi:hypothetical protein